MINNDTDISVALYELLEILGSSTRAKILQLISQRPFYLSEISRTLNIGQQAVIRHMRKLEKSGLVRSYQQDARQSRIPRNYYVIKKDTHIRLRLTPHGFTIIEGTQTPVKKDTLDINKRFPEIAKFFQDLKKLTQPSDQKTRIDLLEKRKRETQKFVNLLAQYQNVLNDHLKELNDLLKITKTSPRE
jgi:ArsR family transcriptional regulator